MAGGPKFAELGRCGEHCSGILSLSGEAVICGTGMDERSCCTSGALEQRKHQKPQKHMDTELWKDPCHGAGPLCRAPKESTHRRFWRASCGLTLAPPFPPHLEAMIFGAAVLSLLSEAQVFPRRAGGLLGCGSFQRQHARVLVVYVLRGAAYARPARGSMACARLLL